MNILTAALAVLFAYQANAATESFDSRKQEILNQLDHMITKIQEQKTCIAKAKTQNDFQKCKSDKRAARAPAVESASQ